MLGAYYSDGFTSGLRWFVVGFLGVMFILGVFVAIIEIRQRREEMRPWDYEIDGECGPTQAHVRLVEGRTLTDEVLQAIGEAEERSMSVAKCLYQYDLREFWPGVTPFDDLPVRCKLRYFDQAEHVMMTLADVEMAK